MGALQWLESIRFGLLRMESIIKMLLLLLLFVMVIMILVRLLQIRHYRLSWRVNVRRYYKTLTKILKLRTQKDGKFHQRLLYHIFDGRKEREEVISNKILIGSVL